MGLLNPTYQSCQTKNAKPNQTYLTKPTKPNVPNQTHQTKPTKPNLPNQTYQTKPTKPNLPKANLFCQICQNYWSKQSTPGSVVHLAMFLSTTSDHLYCIVLLSYQYFHHLRPIANTSPTLSIILIFH